jgi:hypothetical protein
MLDKLTKVLVITSTVAAAAFTVAGVGVLVTDIGPSVVEYVRSTNWVIPGSIAALGVATLTFCGEIGKPFDALMDRMYPNDVKTSVGG